MNSEIKFQFIPHNIYFVQFNLGLNTDSMYHRQLYILDNLSGISILKTGSKKYEYMCLFNSNNNLKEEIYNYLKNDIESVNNLEEDKLINLIYILNKEDNYNKKFIKSLKKDFIDQDDINLLNKEEKINLVRYVIQEKNENKIKSLLKETEIKKIFKGLLVLDIIKDLIFTDNSLMLKNLIDEKIIKMKKYEEYLNQLEQFKYSDPYVEKAKLIISLRNNENNNNNKEIRKVKKI